MRILAVGDSYLSTDVLRRGLEAQDGVDVEYLQLDEARASISATESERRIHEYTGTPDQLVRRIGGADVLLVHGAPVTEEVMAASESLRLVGCARGGPVNVDIAAASRRGIPVVTTPGKNAEAVADATIALLIMLARRFPQAMRTAAKGRPPGPSTFEGAEFIGHELGGHVLGLFGYGRVGQRVAGRARAFGMEVIYYDPYRQADVGETATRVITLDELLEASHFVSLHARASESNENVFSAEAFARMRARSYFVNTARESLVDEAALDAALASGHLAGAGLDVVRPPADGGGHPLLRRGNVVLLPHIGGATDETLVRGVRMLAGAVACLLGGRPLPFVANPDALARA